MKLEERELERLVMWGRRVFRDTDDSWSLKDDELLERLRAEHRNAQRRRRHGIGKDGGAST